LLKVCQRLLSRWPDAHSREWEVPGYSTALA
jgi:hypothetical protein